MHVPEVQKLCCNCQHFEFEFAVEVDRVTDEQSRELTLRCDQDRYDIKGREVAHGQFLMYMYIGQKCEHFKVLDFTGPKGRAGLPSGESFGGGGSISAPPPPSEVAAIPELWK